MDPWYGSRWGLGLLLMMIVDGGNGLVDGKKSWCFGLRYKLYGRFARGRKLEHMYSGYIPF